MLRSNSGCSRRSTADFGVAHPLPAKVAAAIKAADRISAYHEAIALAGFAKREAVRFFGRPAAVGTDLIDLEPWPAPVAERRYLKRFAAASKLAEKET